MLKYDSAIVMSALLVIGSVACAASPSFVDFDRRARAGERLTVVFFGASLTYGANATDPAHTSYRAVIEEMLNKRYPKAHFRCYDASIGGPGSDLGAYRFDRDVLRRKPDLVFLAFSPNDGNWGAEPQRYATWEAILRRSITEAKVPVVAALFPFMWEAMNRTNADHLGGIKQRIKIAAAYNAPAGDAAALIIERIHKKQTTIKKVWPVDGVHPSDAGYKICAEAAWAAFLRGVNDKLVCKAPEKMIHADTYMRVARVRISSLTPLPEGWAVGMPYVSSAAPDWLMSRWLDDVTFVRREASKPGKKDKAKTADAPAAKIAPLVVRFSGTEVAIFGQSSPDSCKFLVHIDGKPVAKPGSKKDAKGRFIFDAGEMGKRVHGKTFFWQVLARGLADKAEHTLKIQPTFTAGAAKQEFMPESICVAGSNPWVKTKK